MTNLAELAEYIRLNLHVPVAGDSNQLILTITLNNGRRQTVLVSVKKFGQAQTIEVRSRCGVVRGAKMIRSALNRNLNSPLGGVAMEKVEEHHVLDCIQRLVVPPGDGVNIAELLYTISSIGLQADVIESKLGHEDVF